MVFSLSAFRDADSARTAAGAIRRLVEKRTFTFMEVCGTHTVAIARSGLKSLLPASLRLLSGPGCPVCVTPQGELERCVAAAERPEITLATFGDMLRVPGRAGSLESARSAGADVRVVYSPRDALKLARSAPDRQVVFAGVGFETTIPVFAAAVREARSREIGNFTILNSFRLVPPALRAVLAAGTVADGFLLPGHVSAVLGTEPYLFLAEEGKSAVVAGFEPLDVLLAVKMLVEQQISGELRVEVAYRRAVRPEGNPEARRLVDEIFEPADADWRGLGRLPASGLDFREEWREFDAARRLDLATPEAPDPPGCRCAEVLLGGLRPRECALFGEKCTPEDPVGPCMVSSEGSCAAEYKYGGGSSDG